MVKSDRLMDHEAYLLRIGYQGSLEPSIETLRGLQRAHLFSVPFENLDIHLKREIRLDENAFFEKIVKHRRGGFCYELNGLFSRLLQQLGFQVTLLSARVTENGKIGQEFDHLVLLVQLEQPIHHPADDGDARRLPPPGLVVGDDRGRDPQVPGQHLLGDVELLPPLADGHASVRGEGYLPGDLLSELLPHGWRGRLSCVFISVVVAHRQFSRSGKLAGTLACTLDGPVPGQYPMHGGR